MTGDTIIDRLVWDDWNLIHIRERHDVTRAEVEQGALHTDPVFLAGYKDRVIAIAPTDAGRVLAIVFGPVPNEPGAWYTFSARPASRKERGYYRQQKGVKHDDE